jgi:GTP pyrophosphokinase
MNDQLISFLAGIKIIGTDELGLVNNITKIISAENNVNMRSIKFDTDDGIFEGTIMIYVHDTKHLNHLIDVLKKVKGVSKVQRIDEKD